MGCVAFLKKIFCKRNEEGDVLRCLEIWVARYMHFLSMESERVVFKWVLIMVFAY